VDDVIDLSTQPEKTGKVPGTDIKAGVVTLPLLYLREQAATDAGSAALLERIERGAKAADDADSSDFDAAIGELRHHAATTDTLADAHRWAREAVEALAPLPKGPIKTALTRFADSIVERSS
jgi:heptaprenyl diphosphate synthase